LDRTARALHRQSAGARTVRPIGTGPLPRAVQSRSDGPPHRGSVRQGPGLEFISHKLMKITHVTPYMHPAAGGPPVVVDRLSRELAARGHDVRVLTTDLFGREDLAWASDDSRPYRMEVFRALGGNGYGFSRPLWRAMGAAARESDVVHIHTLWT